MGKSAAMDFQVHKDSLEICRWTDLDGGNPLDPRPGQILLEIERFAFTANNITYANFGQEMDYWKFFPSGEEDWGRIPVWGFAEVLESRVEEIAAGTRIFGFLPMSTHLLMQPGAVSKSGLVDQLPHRKALHGVYNQYQLIPGEAEKNDHFDDLQMLLRPLFITSFLIDDFLADSDFFGATCILLSSASSKTAMGLAHLLKTNRKGQCQVIGLTSAAHVQYVQSLGCYDRVLAYSELAALPAKEAVVYVDMAGNAKLRHDLHHHFGDALRHDCVVGNAHGQKPQATVELPGARPKFFFAPARIQKREQDWGRGGVMRKFAGSWTDFVPVASDWLQINRHTGQAAVERVYRKSLAGQVNPNEGNILGI